MDKFTLSIYEGRKKARTAVADETMLTMGIVRKLADLIDFEVEKDVLQMSRLIDKTWNELEDILGLLFEDLAHEEWDNVRTADIVKLIKQIIEISVAQALLIPSSKQEDHDPFLEMKTPTFGESLFKIEYNLCQAFSYTPDKLDRMAYKEVIEIYSNMRRVQIEDKRIADRKRELEEKGIKFVPAKGNDW